MLYSTRVRLQLAESRIKNGLPCRWTAWSGALQRLQHRSLVLQIWSLDETGVTSGKGSAEKII